MSFSFFNYCRVTKYGFKITQDNIGEDEEQIASDDSNTWWNVEEVRICNVTFC